LGKNGPEIPVIGLGCMGMSDFYGPADDAQSIDVIHRAIDRGMGFLDTADAYGMGRNESLVGRAIADRRSRAVVATKFALVRAADGTFTGISGKPEYVKRCCEASLRRLGTGTIDLYYQHRVDPTVPVEETVGAMAELVREGKVRQLGLSEVSPATLRRAHAVHPIAAVQSEYSLWTRDPESGMLAACTELGVTFVAYSPLGRGFLTGKIRSIADLAPDDWRRQNPRFQADNFEKNLVLVRRIESLAAARKITPAQLALAWVVSRLAPVVAIPGTRSAARLDENAAAADITLTAAEVTAIDQALPHGSAVGSRYPEASMKLVNA
jgi:aryl-alcohol dehydrogenase-like predicted oxidoreductase